MDVVDFAIFRYMFPGGEGRFWGSHSVIDPRITPREIGERVGLSEVAVRQRIAKLRTDGFIQGYDVWPNPHLFGASLRVLEVPAQDTRTADSILHQLNRIHGVVSARVMIDEDSRRIRVSFVEDTPDKTERRAREILRLTELGAPLPSRPEWIPSCSRSMKPVDWRIIAELRNAPELGLGEHARRLGVTLKTLSRRFHELLDSHSILWTLNADNSHLSVAVCVLRLQDPVARDSVCREIQTRVGSWLPMALGGLGDPPQTPASLVAGMFWIQSPAATEALNRVLLRIPGVRSVERRFPSTAISVPAWFDAQLEERLTTRHGSGTEFGPMLLPSE